MHWEISSIDCSNNAPQLLPAFPAGLLYGYSVYTTFRHPLPQRWLEAHLQRLENNARAIGLSWPYSQTYLLEMIQQCATPDKPVFRLTAMADVENYGDFYTGEPLSCRLILSVRPSTAGKSRSIALKSIVYTRPMHNIKLGVMVELIGFKRKARIERYDDVLLLNTSAHISEASTANIFFIRNGTLLTPQPERDLCLPGITRLQILEAATQARIPSSEATPITMRSIRDMDGAFLTNAAQGLILINRIDDHILPWPTAAQEITTLLAKQLI